jgi:hypothetical protein
MLVKRDFQFVVGSRINERKTKRRIKIREAGGSVEFNPERQLYKVSLVDTFSMLGESLLLR